MIIARVFPSKTNATPDDDLCYFSGPPLWRVDCNEVHVSCTFTWDKARAEHLYNQWKSQGYNVRLGGPAYDDKGGDFVPGMYIKKGYVITSRGCNNKCWFCLVPKREGVIRELPIVDGYNVLDSNLLQCSDNHIKDVFAMLKRQKQRPEFTGGIEAKILQEWQAKLIAGLKPKVVFMAYDTPDDYEPLKRASEMFFNNGLMKTSHHTIKCYVLCGYRNDTKEAATKRFKQVMNLGVMPFAMLYRSPDNKVREDWRGFQREWANNFIVGYKMKRKTTPDTEKDLTKTQDMV